MKLVWIIILSLYLATRLFNLDLIPIFNDEANYIFWAKNIATSAHGWFISLTNGKPPIFIWEIVLFIKLLPASQYLIAGRLPSVLAGLFSLVGIFKLAKLLFKSEWMANLAAIFYVFTPFTLFYDRLALFDSLLTATSTWSVYFALKTAKTEKVLDAAKWGIALGLALLSKPSGGILLLLTPLGYFLFSQQKKILSVAVPVSLALVMHFPIFFSRGVHDYIKLAVGYTSAGSGHPFAFSFEWISWLTSYLTPPIFFLGLFSLVSLFKESRKISLVLTTLWLFPIIIFSIVIFPFFPRYFLFTTPFFLIAAAYIIHKIPILILVLAFPIWFSLFLLTKPEQVPLPNIEDWQYISGYPSSNGFQPIYKYINKSIANGPVTLFVQGSFSHFPHAFDLYYWGNPQIKIYERWPLVVIDDQMKQAKKNSQVYVVVRKNTRADESDPLKELPLKVLVEGKKPHGPDSVYLTTFD